MTDKTVTIHAKDHLDPDGSIVESALRVADAIVLTAYLDDVVVSLAGVRGLSSSFFNALLRRLIDAYGVETVTMRLRFEFDTALQQDLYRRSLAAVTKSAA